MACIFAERYTVRATGAACAGVVEWCSNVVPEVHGISPFITDRLSPRQSIEKDGSRWIHKGKRMDPLRRACRPPSPLWWVGSIAKVW